MGSRRLGKTLVGRFVLEAKRAGEIGLAFFLTAGVASCGGKTTGGPGISPNDATTDSPNPEGVEAAAHPEGGFSEAAQYDGPYPEAVQPDSGFSEAVQVDSGFGEAAAMDGSFSEAAQVEGGVVEAVAPDAGLPTDATVPPADSGLARDATSD